MPRCERSNQFKDRDVRIAVRDGRGAVRVERLGALAATPEARGGQGAAMSEGPA